MVKTVKDMATNVAQGVASGITGFLSTLTGIVLSLVTVPFILFYLLKEGEKLPKFMLKVCPPRMRKEVTDIFHDMDKQISSYIQGQILVSMCIGAMVTIGFLIIGMKYALLLGFLAMITSVVPYLGPVIAITPAVIIALVTSPLMLIKLAINCMDNRSVNRRKVHFTSNYGEITQYSPDYDYLCTINGRLLIWCPRRYFRDSRLCNL